MNIDELLAQSAHRIAADVTPPPAPHPLRLGAQAVSVRRRRRVGVAAAATVAAVVAAAVLAPNLGGRPSDAEPAEVPASPRLGNVPAWVDLDGDIHVGGHELDLPQLEVPEPQVPYELQVPVGPTSDRMPRFGLTARGVVWNGASENAPLYWQALNGEPVELTAQRPLFFTADPLGDVVVWVTTGQEMVTYDVGEGRVVDSRSVPGLVAGDDVGRMGTTLPVLFVDDDRVVYEIGEDVWTLDLEAGTTTRMAEVPASDLLDYVPGVSVVAVSGQADDGADDPPHVAQLEFRSPTGTVRAQPARLFREGRLSPDGRWFVTSTDYAPTPFDGLRTVVLDTRTGHQVALDLPDKMRGAYPDPWGWAGSDVLMVGLLRRSGDGEDPWTCRPSFGRCDLLPRAASYVYPW